MHPEDGLCWSCIISAVCAHGRDYGSYISKTRRARFQDGALGLDRKTKQMYKLTNTLEIAPMRTGIAAEVTKGEQTCQRVYWLEPRLFPTVCDLIHQPSRDHEGNLETTYIHDPPLFGGHESVAACVRRRDGKKEWEGGSSQAIRTDNPT